MCHFQAFVWCEYHRVFVEYFIVNDFIVVLRPLYYILYTKPYICISRYCACPIMSTRLPSFSRHTEYESYIQHIHTYVSILVEKEQTKDENKPLSKLSLSYKLYIIVHSWFLGFSSTINPFQDFQTYEHFISFV